MKFYLNFICSLLLIVLSDACKQPDAERAYMQLSGKAQGTTFLIKYNNSAQINLASQVDSIFRLMDKSMSLWDSTSTIVKFNQNQLEIPHQDTHFIAVFKRSQQISALTDGSFDATVAPLVRRWGFHFRKKEPPPDDAEIQQLLQCVGWQKVNWNGRGVVKSVPCAQLDFNAIAQGYTVDLIAQMIENHGIRDYMVEVGGEVRAAGKNEKGQTWKIGIDKPIFADPPPSDTDRPLQEVIALNNKSLATSGSYRKFIEKDGKRYSHTIDPATGKPVQHQLLSVSVVADNCTDADAFATAFMVMGWEKSQRLAEKLGLAVLFIFENEQRTIATTKVGWSEELTAE